MKGKTTSLVILVDEKDTPTGTMEKIEAHEKGVLHRAISVFICDSKGQWLLQRRALNKYHSNGLWTNACCSHPLPGETTEEAAHRRLMEEMGLKAPLRKLFHFTYKATLNNGLTEHELDHVFLGITDETPAINPNEVKEWKHLSYHQLVEEIENRPENFTVWFKKIHERVQRKIAEFKEKEKMQSG